ncbi:hypothetical protein [Nocardiopsis aegyptia]|uniref:Uncharacterized protein n=1 Tax=Nocardiopsis aegyptia TaxID=220378 RepID=A0A7Z0ESC1_9ACTN|nr:hypothetical protein [Nocardiopsis aegyptia]
MTRASEQRPRRRGGTTPARPPERGVVVGVDLRGIQAYVYSGRRILDAVGRAALVAELTDTSDRHHGIADLVPEDCVVLRDAGGALTVVLPDPAAARAFTARYTRLLRDRAGDLTPVVAHVPYGPDAPAGERETAGDAGEEVSSVARGIDETAEAPRGVDAVRAAARGVDEAAEAPRGVDAVRAAARGVDEAAVARGVDEALERLPARLRAARRRMSALHTPAHGYGITAVCSVGGGPAESVDSSRAQDDRAGVPERVAADVARARGIGRRWHRAHSAAWLAGAATATGRPRLELPMEIDRLGRDHGDLSRIAVVHIDVNGLGAILGEYRDRAGDPAVPGSGAAAQRGLSTRIAGLTEGLARALVRAVATTVRADPGRPATVPGSGAAAPLTLHRSPTGTVRLPVRPIVVAGDDLTVLCDARLALSLTRYALDWLDADPERIGAAGDPRVALHRELARAHGGVGARTVAGARGTHTAHTTFVPTVGVGIAVQPVGAPLSLGYDLCEAMCRRAKDHRVELMEHGAPDDHAVAWTTRFDGVDRVLRRLDRARSAAPPRTALPMTGTAFADFLDRYLSAGAPDSLLADGDTRHRSWLVSSLVPLLKSGGDPSAELHRRTRVTGVPAALPRDWTPGALLDAVEVLDLYLDPGLAAALEPHRPHDRGRTGVGGPLPGPTGAPA